MAAKNTAPSWVDADLCELDVVLDPAQGFCGAVEGDLAEEGNVERELATADDRYTTVYVLVFVLRMSRLYLTRLCRTHSRVPKACTGLLVSRIEFLKQTAGPGASPPNLQLSRLHKPPD